MQAANQAWIAWARAIVHGGDLPESQAGATSGVCDLAGYERATRAILCMEEGQRLRRRGEHAAALAKFTLARRELAPLVRRGLAEVRWALAWCRLWRAHADYSRGAFAEALRVYADLLPEMSESGDERGLVAVFRGLGNVSKYLGLYAEAAEHYDRSTKLAESSGDRIGLAMARHNLGNVMLALDDFEGAEKTYRQAAGGFARTRRRDLLQHAWVNLAEVAQRSGNPREAMRRLKHAERIGRATAINAGFEAERLIALGSCRLQLGWASAARQSFEAAQKLATCAGEVHIEALAWRALAAAHLESKSPHDALHAAGNGLRCTRASGTPTEVCGVLHELAARAAREMRDWRVESRPLEQALEEQKRLSTHLAEMRARTISLHRELVRVRHEAELARMEKAKLEDAVARVAGRLRAFESDGRATTIEEVEPEALQPLGLSKRESEVLLWVLRGKTNAEIAIILGCGAETVKTHLKRIYQQLDVNNRAAAATAALQFSARARRMRRS